MIAVKVTYSVKADYVSTNIANIDAFLKNFEKLDNRRFLYSVFQHNENTFVHLSQYKDEQIQKELLADASFVAFQKQRDENLSSKPEICVMNFIGASNKIF